LATLQRREQALRAHDFGSQTRGAARRHRDHHTIRMPQIHGGRLPHPDRQIHGRLARLQQTHRFVCPKPPIQQLLAVAGTVVVGRSLGCVTYSAQHRFSGSALEATRWLSDSRVRFRMNAGLYLPKTAMCVSLPGRDSASLATLTSAMSYVSPFLHASAATPQHLNNISVTGSNFGTYDGVLPVASTRSDQPLPAARNTTVCEANTLDSRQAGLTITAAIFTLSLSNVSRLDDVTVFIDFLANGSSNPSTYILMKNKCSCFSETTSRFEFHVLSPGLPTVPKSSCAMDGRYLPEAAAGI
jgi:hypothetical protein